MNQESTRIEIAEDVLARAIGDSLVLFHPVTERLVTLNASGRHIWEMLSECGDAAQLITQLADQFNGLQADIQQQTLEFLTQLESEQMIRLNV
jgi:hypothetical protein